MVPKCSCPRQTKILNEKQHVKKQGKKAEKYIPNTTMRIEVLRMNVSCDRVDDFIKDDNENSLLFYYNGINFDFSTNPMLLY